MIEAIITGVISGSITGLIISIVQFYIVKKLKKRIRRKWIEELIDGVEEFIKSGKEWINDHPQEIDKLKKALKDIFKEKGSEKE